MTKDEKYRAIIAPARNLRPHSNPKYTRIQLATVRGYTVIVSMGVQEGDRGVFFKQDIELSEEFATVHDLVRRTDPDTGEKVGGFLEPNRRIRALKLGGEESWGLWMPLSCLEYTGADLSKLEDGSELDELNGHDICGQWVNPQTSKAAARRAIRLARQSTPSFPKHRETHHLRDSLGTIPPDALITVTEKCHGTSHRYGHVHERSVAPQTWLQRLFRRKPKTIGGWAELSGSRNVILSDAKDPYYNDPFREIVPNLLRGQLHKGEVVYGEIVGYTTTGAAIMDAQDITKLNDKTLRKRYGDRMEYRYGCEVGTCRFLVYRIIMTNEDGVVFEYPWWRIVERCAELGIEHVPYLTSFFWDGDADHVLEQANFWCVGPSTLDSGHIREGIVLRVDSSKGTKFLKHKSMDFGMLEGYLREAGVVDMEEAS